MVILILITVVLYLLLWATFAYYISKMKKLNDADKKLRLTYNVLGVVALVQIIALIGIIIFYAIRLNDVEIEVPEIAAVLFLILQIVGFIGTGYFGFGYRRKHFPEYCKKGKIEKKAIGLNYLISVGFTVSAMNFAFNLMASGAIAYFIGTY